MRLFRNPNIPFVKIRMISYIIAGILVLGSIVLLLTRGVNWSIDFTSGVSASINLKAADPNTPLLNVATLRNVLNKHGFPEAEIQNIGDPANASFLIKIKSKTDDEEVTSGVKDEILKIIQQNLPEYVQGRDLAKDVVEEIYVVGPKVGGELRSQATVAVIIALILMVIYVWFRFELTFGVMAILALFHDVIIVLGVFSLTGKEITTQIIAALLTIVGYSINDTIVVFDRIREDLVIYRNDPLPSIFNRALNSTLSRTTVTTITTLFSALALYFFGGTVLHDFALAMVLGVIVGTFSSVFLASNLVLDVFSITRKEKQRIQKLTKKK
ncbi:MAG: protein translocase subunit SecF [Candidatus Cloacimonetes bacterium]|nr:protein translocase subunit SecF [Candidatus Cloacimonadota bacterium]NLK49248.1 protein translocase subunit SecF [Candidatus Cloacimonadota bacterium]